MKVESKKQSEISYIVKKFNYVNYDIRPPQKKQLKKSSWLSASITLLSRTGRIIFKNKYC